MSWDEDIVCIADTILYIYYISKMIIWNISLKERLGRPSRGWEDHIKNFSWVNTI
jgi:hypothetical protein